MMWKQIGEISDLRDHSWKMKLSDDVQISDEGQKLELLHSGRLRLGRIELKVEENKILASFPVRRMPHVID